MESSLSNTQLGKLDRKVYATMITDDSYLPGLQVLHYTLRKFTSRTLVIIAIGSFIQF